MTIRKGEEWGTLRVPSGPIAVVGSDADARSLIEVALADGAPIPTIGLIGGDLMRTLGGTGDRARFTGHQPIPHLPIDLVRVVADDDRETIFVAHLIARRSWWQGQVTAVMNAQFLTDDRRRGHRAAWDVAPRSHPNDGRCDVVTASADLSARQRWMARPRLLLGTHVPHPLITVRQHSLATLDLAAETPLWVDGRRWGSARRLRLTVEPDAFTVCV